MQLGVAAAQAALRDAELDWRRVQMLSCGGAARCGSLGHLAASAIAESLGWQGAELRTSSAGCVSAAHALSVARDSILSGRIDVALVLGADVVPPGVLAPESMNHPSDPNHLRYSLGLTNPVYLGLEARRRFSLYGTTEEDLDLVKVKNARHGSLNPNARYRFKVEARQVRSSPLVADPLRLFHICATSDGAAAVVVSSIGFAKAQCRPFVFLAGISTASSTYPNPELEMGYLATDPIYPDRGQSFKTAMITTLYEQTGVGPQDLSCAEVYDLSSASELDWYERLGLCPRGAAERLLREGDSSLGGRIPVNLSGGLASMGEAIAAQPLAQVCEITSQLRGHAAARQVANASVGIAVSQATFGLGAAIMLKR